MIQNECTKILGIRHPIIQAPMAGGVTTTTLVTQASKAGCLGMIGAGYLSAEQLHEQILEIQKETPLFGVNLFVPKPFTIDQGEVQEAQERLNPFRSVLGLDQQRASIKSFDKLKQTFDQQIDVIISTSVPVCSFTFGLPSEDVVKRLKENGTVLIGTATTVSEAIACEKAGMDLVTVQGSEAGGHRGNFLHHQEESMIGLMSLIPQVSDAVNIPVIAAGGIMEGRGIAASLMLGAQAVQMGTAFLTTSESGAHSLHKDKILSTTEDEVILTRAFSGKWARGIQNTYTLAMQQEQYLMPDFPITNSLTKPIRQAAGQQNNSEFLSLWSGQSPRLAKSESVRELVTRVISEVDILLGDSPFSQERS
ncbi:nitronate monooxygenase [Jeotgalibacillus malaysiensis]|uniref:Probable nitronate monooxygenase n=1 Tax=Jeotgalibacillus malaysiensis TaxID=1508404 RepID=A0A0B5AI59_9BACL|nr:nitronate monooxygenase [Jeotgalibacillus malaysiensis]AJD89746.1 nitronate monooxygenase [Jeotgalibacillus malaysiensis]